MRLKAILMSLVVLIAVSGVAQADLVYSGADLSAGLGSMTIKNTVGPGGTGATLWEADIDRLAYNMDVMFTAFRVNGVNHAAPTGWGYGLWNVGDGANDINDGTFTELSKSAGAYSFSLTRTEGVWDHETVFTLNAADLVNTHWTAPHTITNNDPDPQLPYGLVNWRLNVAAGTYGDSGYLLDGTSGGADRNMVLAANPDGPWRVNENVDRGAGGLDPTDTMWGKATVLDNAAAAAMGLVPGLEFSTGGSVVAYYPSSAIGNADVTGTYDRVFIEATPREFIGSVRADHQPLAQGESFVDNVYLDINIAVPEPMTLGLLAVGGLGVLLRKRRRA